MRNHLYHFALLSIMFGFGFLLGWKNHDDIVPGMAALVIAASLTVTMFMYNKPE